MSSSDDGVQSGGGSWALQGCLFGAVALFVVLLITMIFLAYRQFRTHTAEPDVVSWIIEDAPSTWLGSQYG